MVEYAVVDCIQSEKHSQRLEDSRNWDNTPRTFEKRPNPIAGKNIVNRARRDGKGNDRTPEL